MHDHIHRRLYIIYIGILVLFGIVPTLLLDRIGWDESRQTGLHHALLAAGALLALLSTHLTLAGILRAIETMSAALSAAREGQFGRLDEAGVLAPLIASFNAMSGSLDARQRELHEELRRTALLTRLSIELRETLDPQAVVRDVLAAITANTDAEYAEILLLGPGGTIDLGYECHLSQIAPLPAEQARQVLERGLAGWALRNGRSVVLGDVSRDERWIAAEGQGATGSAMVLPITHGRTTLGALTIAHSAPDHFTSKDLLLLEGVVAQAGVALNAACRQLEEQRYREQAFLLFSMSQFLTSERSAADLARELLEKSDAVFDARYSALFLFDNPAKQLRLFAARGDDLHGEAPGQLREVAEQAMREQAAVTTALEHQAAGLLAANEPYIANASGRLACVALPLLHNGAAIGVFALARPAQGTAVFPARVWSMLTTFTNVIAAAFANLELVDRLQDRAEELARLVDERTLQLQRSRDLLRVLFDNLPDGLVMMAPDLRVLTANGAFCRGIFGLAPQSVVGRTYTQIVEEVAQAAYLRIEAVPAAAGQRRVRATDIAGQQRWFEVDRYPIKSDLDGGEQTIERWRDITRQEELHRRLLLHQQLTSLGHLAASVVHEVGNPLQSVRACLELCREDRALSTPNAEYLDLADAELGRIDHLLDRLRDLYRAPSLEWAPVDVNQLIVAVRGMTLKRLADTQIKLEVELAPELPAIIGQPNALRQVLLNLLFNAREAMPAGGTIHVATYADEKRSLSCVRVSDTGAGISAERLHTIFEPFNSSRSQRPGLGMYLSRQVVQQHRGSIDVSSKVGGGTVVVVGLPWREEDDDEDNDSYRRR